MKNEEVILPSVFVFVMIGAGLLHMILPETNGCKLPKTMQEANRSRYSLSVLWISHLNCVIVLHSSVYVLENMSILWGLFNKSNINQWVVYVVIADRTRQTDYSTARLFDGKCHTFWYHRSFCLFPLSQNCVWFCWFAGF